MKLEINSETKDTTWKATKAVFDVVQRHADMEGGNPHKMKIEYHISDPLTDFAFPEAQLFSVEVGPETPESTIILLAGYGWGTPTYISTLKQFLDSDNALKQRMILVDWLGTGASTRCINEPNKCSYINYFIDSLKSLMRQRKWDQRPMYLGGHSIGGYLVGCFSEKYPQNIEHLFLLSPCGLPLLPDQMRDEKKYPIDDFKGSIKGFRRVAFWATRKLWTWQLPPNAYFQVVPSFLSKKQLRAFVSNRGGPYCNSDPDLTDAIVEWLYAAYSSTTAGEKGIFVIFASGSHAYRPLCEILSISKIPHMSFFYGNKDWMDPEHCVDFLSKMSDMHPDKKSFAKLYEKPDIIENPPFIIDKSHFTFELSEPLPPGPFSNFTLFILHDAGHQVTFGRNSAVHSLIITMAANEEFEHENNSYFVARRIHE